MEQQRHPFVDRQNEGIEVSARRMNLLNVRGLLPQKFGKDDGHNARRVHSRTHFSGKCTDARHLMLILSTFSEYPDCPSARKKR